MSGKFDVPDAGAGTNPATELRGLADLIDRGVAVNGNQLRTIAAGLPAVPASTDDGRYWAIEHAERCTVSGWEAFRERDAALVSFDGLCQEVGCRILIRGAQEWHVASEETHDLAATLIAQLAAAVLAAFAPSVSSPLVRGAGDSEPTDAEIQEARAVLRKVWGEWDPEAYSYDLWPDMGAAVLPMLRAVLAARPVPAAQPDPAAMVEQACDWKNGYTEGQTHEAFHFGHLCPYEVCAALLRGEPDPRRSAVPAAQEHGDETDEAQR